MKLRLLGLWSLSLVASVAVAIMLIQLYRKSTEAQVWRRAEAVVARACDLILYGFYAAGWSGPGPILPDERLRGDLTTVVSLALAHQDGVEGGIWQSDSGPLPPLTGAVGIVPAPGRTTAS